MRLKKGGRTLLNFDDELVYVGAAQCYSYIYECQMMLFGGTSLKTVLYDHERDDGVFKFYGVLYGRKLNKDEYKTVIQHAGVGTHLRVDWQGK